MSRISIEEQFNRIAREYDDNRAKFIPCFHAFYDETTEFLTSVLAPPTCVLDLGAGTGLLTQYWRRRAPSARYVLADVAQDMLDVARERFADAKDVTFCCLDYTSALPQGAYDAVISALSVHHLEDADKQTLFARICERLPQGGYFVNYDQFCADDARVGEWYDREWETHLAERSGLTKRDLDAWRVRRQLDRECSITRQTQMLRACGFSSVQCVYAYRKFAVILAVK